MMSVSRNVTIDNEFVRKHVVHCQELRHDVYIGRPSKWGNPFVVGRDGDHEMCVAKYLGGATPLQEFPVGHPLRSV